MARCPVCDYPMDRGEQKYSCPYGCYTLSFEADTIIQTVNEEEFRFRLSDHSNKRDDVSAGINEALDEARNSVRTLALLELRKHHVRFEQRNAKARECGSADSQMGRVVSNS